MVMKYVNWAMRRADDDSEIPRCPDHDVPMRLRGYQGRPTRFARQTEQVYTYVYFCPIDGCNRTVLKAIPRSQAPVPGEVPERPVYARRQEY